MIAIVAEMVEQGKDLSQFVNELIWYLRNLLVVKTADEAEQLVDMSEENRQELSRFAEQMNWKFCSAISVFCRIWQMT